MGATSSDEAPTQNNHWGGAFSSNPVQSIPPLAQTARTGLDRPQQSCTVAPPTAVSAMIRGSAPAIRSAPPTPAPASAPHPESSWVNAQPTHSATGNESRANPNSINAHSRNMPAFSSTLSQRRWECTSNAVLKKGVAVAAATEATTTIAAEGQIGSPIPTSPGISTPRPARTGPAVASRRFGERACRRGRGFCSPDPFPHAKPEPLPQRPSQH